MQQGADEYFLNRGETLIDWTFILSDYCSVDPVITLPVGCEVSSCRKLNHKRAGFQKLP